MAIWTTPATLSAEKETAVMRVKVSLYPACSMTGKTTLRHIIVTAIIGNIIAASIVGDGVIGNAIVIVGNDSGYLWYHIHRCCLIDKQGDTSLHIG